MRIRTALKWTAGTFAVAIGAYAGYVGTVWLRYGHPVPANADEVDPLLDQFVPVYDVAERHHIHIAAPAEMSFAAGSADGWRR